MRHDIAITAMYLATMHCAGIAETRPQVVLVGGPLPEPPRPDAVVKMLIRDTAPISATNVWVDPKELTEPRQEHFWRRFDRRRKHKRKHHA